ncbi:MAG: diacylglycerol kinase family protein [Candidatus Omnitrophota bacterium]
MKYFLIFNPGSRDGQSEKRIPRIHRLLKERAIDYEYGITGSPQDAYALSQKANASGYDVVVAVGGDGTVNKVLNGFYDDTGLRTSNARFGVIYTGTSPDFCKSYCVPYGNIEQSINVLLAGTSTKIQIGKITLAARMNLELNGKSARSGPDFIARYFSCCANIGLGAAVARYANSGARKMVGDCLGTFSALVKVFMNYHPSEVSISFNGKKELVSRLYNLSVGKTFHVASGIKVKNNLVEGDDNFYVLIIRNISWLRVPYCLKCIYSGKEIPRTGSVCLTYAQYIEISGTSDTPEVEFDGDPQGFLPCRIEMAKEKLELIHEAD